MSKKDAANASLLTIVMQNARLRIFGIIKLSALENVIRFLKGISQSGGAMMKTTSFHRRFSVQISCPMFLNQGNII
jgi:hypothetical protein